MVERRLQRRLRVAFLWVLTATLVGWMVYDRDISTADAPTPVADDAEHSALFRINGVSNADVAPGDAIVVFVASDDPDQPLSATVSKAPAQILSRQPGRVVVKIPPETEPGKASIRLVQGDLRTKPHDLRVRLPKRAKLFREIIGGIALLVLGLRTLARGLRSWAGQGMRIFLQTLASATPRALGVGMAVGAATQLSTSAAALVVSLVESRLLAFGAGAAILLGAHLGAVISGAVLPLGFTRGSLPLVVIGVAWLTVAVDRRAQSFGKVLVGTGLLFYGLHVLVQGIEPLASDPAILPFIGLLHAGTGSGLLTCVLVGTVLSALLQGPGPTFGIVLGLAQASGAFGLTDGVAVLSGCLLGASINSAAVAWPWGGESRKLAVAQLSAGAVGTVVMVPFVGLISRLAESIVPGDSSLVAWTRHGASFPRMGEHLGAGFLLSQGFAVGVAALFLPTALRFATRRAQAEAPRRRASDRAPALEARGRVELAAAVALHAGAISRVLAMAKTGDREKGVEAEHILGDARATIEQLAPTLATAAGDEESSLLPAAISLLHLQRSIEELLRSVERRVERNLAVVADDGGALLALETLVLAGLESVRSSLSSGTPSDLEQARAREIRINAREAAERRSIGRTGAVSAERVASTELLDALENVGNHVYRASEVLAADVDALE